MLHNEEYDMMPVGSSLLYCGMHVVLWLWV